jgi:hypothetical protein
VRARIAAGRAEERTASWRSLCLPLTSASGTRGYRARIVATDADTVAGSRARLREAVAASAARANRDEARRLLAEADRAVLAAGGRGPGGNSRLTATTGIVLLALFLVEGLTLVALGPLLSTHVFVGMLLLPPVALKLGSTGYRFARYYLGDRAYRAAGPPHPLLRMLGPLVIAATAALFASGVAMIWLGPGSGWLVSVHQVSAIVWAFVIGLHVLGHLVELPALASSDVRGPRPGRAGSWWRRLALASAIVSGVVLALATVQYAAPWQSRVGDHGEHEGAARVSLAQGAQLPVALGVPATTPAATGAAR